MTYRDSRFTAIGSGGGNATLPTIVAGDYLAAFISADANGDCDNATLTGFTRVDVKNHSAPDGHSFAYFEKFPATGSEGATATLGGITAGDCAAITVSLSGRDTTSPRTFLTPTQNTSSNASVVSLGATGGTAGSGDDVIYFAGLDQTNGDTGWAFAPPSGYTERQDPAGASQAWCAMYRETIA